jgi:hypothetical protein
MLNKMVFFCAYFALRASTAQGEQPTGNKSRLDTGVKRVLLTKGAFASRFRAAATNKLQADQQACCRRQYKLLGAVV